MTRDPKHTTTIAQKLKHAAKFVVPMVFTVGAVGFLVRELDFKAILPHLNARSLLIFVPALLLYGAVSLLLDALSLRRPIHSTRADFTVVKAARLKAASYLVAIIHIAAGAGSLAYLLRRQAGVTLSHAMGVVILLMMFDLGIVLSLVVIGTSMIAASTVQLQLGIVFAIIGAMLGGFALLRAPFSLGPLDRIRDLDLFLAARTIPARELLELAVLRLCFVMSMEMFGWVALWSFGIVVPLANFLVNFSAVLLVGTMPAVAGIGPSQLAMVEFFKSFGSRESLFACAMVFTIGLIGLRAVIGLAFAGEYNREAFAAAREAEAAIEGEA